MKKYLQKALVELSRRRFLNLATMGVPLWYLGQSKTLKGQAPPNKRFVQIFLAGGWDTALATDPVIGSKTGSSTYDSSYAGRPNTTVTGKDRLIVGEGLGPAESAFRDLNTAFINGMFVEVTAHELATKYLMSGRSTLSRSREFPALCALMGAARGEFPPHLNLGQVVPLGDTKETNPPLHAVSSDHLTAMLSGPRADEGAFNDNAINNMNGLIVSLDSIRNETLTTGQQARLRGWRSASSNLGAIYDNRYDLQMVIDAAMTTKYEIEAGETWRMPAHMASAFLALRSGLARYITVHGGSYDTHSNHFATHVPELQLFSRNLAAFVDDLRNTPDPADSSVSLADTTTILVTSEFSRTPALNLAAGTDHWQSASAILMGPEVRDNTVLGATGDDAMPLGWQNGATTTFSTDTELNAGHLFASIVRRLGHVDPADTISLTDLGDLFTT